MANIKAPFNFVPLSDKVFFPDWADKISHDIPFEDGVSGTIELEITAKTPIFVRNGHTQTDADEKNEEYRSFSKAPDNSYFIPATSIKGAIRNVLEIMSFGKMRVDENAKFAQREWNNAKLFPLKGNPNEQKKLCCGWLFERDEKYIVKKSRNLYRINHLRLDEYFDKERIFHSYFSKESNFNLNRTTKIGPKEYDPKTAVFKYDLLKSKGINLDALEGLSFEEDSEYSTKFQENRVRYAKNGDIKGSIVLTGQPDPWIFPREKNGGKFYEFVFDKNIEREIELSEEEFKHYQFIYTDSPDWGFAKRRMKTDGMPVFFRQNKDGSIKDLGLAFLYKLPYDYSPLELEQKRYRKEDIKKPDLAEAIFGYTYGKDALRGRVQFSHCFCGNPEEDKNYTLVLNSPKASYYPIYIRQENGSRGIVTDYQTYNDGKLSGWKRYHVRKHVWEKCTNDPKIDTTIYPLKANSRFTGKIYFHNLKSVELGALLSALTFHNTDDCFHQIGQGKPFGFGKISLIAKLNPECKIDQELVMAEFEELMHKSGIYNWSSDNSIVQLFTLAHEEVTADDVLFQYMALDIGNRNKNEFIEAKGGISGKGMKEYLQLYSELKKKKYGPISLREKHIDTLEKNKAEEAEKERMRLLELAEMEKQKEEEAARKAEELAKRKLQEKISAGLEFLEDRYDDGRYKVTDFKGAKNRIENWIKKAKLETLPDDEIQILTRNLIRIYNGIEKERDRKDWKNPNSNTWINIKKWIGEKSGEKLFNEIVK